jgi:hypothetical protein
VILIPPDVTAAKPDPPNCVAATAQIPGVNNVNLKPERVQTLGVDELIVIARPLDADAVNV